LLVLIVGAVLWSCGRDTPRVAETTKHSQAGAQLKREDQAAQARAQEEEQAKARAEQEARAAQEAWARARAREMEQAARATEEAKARQEALASRPRVELIPIESHPAIDVWRRPGDYQGRRVRLTGEAEVKRSAKGVYAVFRTPTGTRMATVSVRNEDAEPLHAVEVGGSAKLNVNLETTVQGTGELGQLALADAEFLPLDAPEGFVSVELSPAPEPARAALRQTAGAPEIPTTGKPPNYTVAAPTPPAFVDTGPNRVNVRGYYRRDGTYVRAHSRAAPGGGGGHHR
jgi:hypothetical protein